MFFCLINCNVLLAYFIFYLFAFVFVLFCSSILLFCSVTFCFLFMYQCMYLQDSPYTSHIVLWRSPVSIIST